MWAFAGELFSHRLGGGVVGARAGGVRVRTIPLEGAEGRRERIWVTADPRRVRWPKETCGRTDRATLRAHGNRCAQDVAECWGVRTRDCDPPMSARELVLETRPSVCLNNSPANAHQDSQNADTPPTSDSAQF